VTVHSGRFASGVRRRARRAPVRLAASIWALVACTPEPSGVPCAAAGSHSQAVEGGGCECEEDYAWCAPDDPLDHRCCALEPCASGSENHLDDGVCVCNVGFVWCQPDGEATLQCCPFGASNDSGSSGTSDTGDTGATDG
jgi:hypothetical protein